MTDAVLGIAFSAVVVAFLVCGIFATARHDRIKAAEARKLKA